MYEISIDTNEIFMHHLTQQFFTFFSNKYVYISIDTINTVIYTNFESYIERNVYEYQFRIISNVIIFFYEKKRKPNILV